MSKLNEISLYWHLSSPKLDLEQQVQLALNRWNIRKDTKDIVPEDIVFHDETETELTEILGLTVKFDKRVQKNHLKIVGSLFNESVL